MFRFHHLLLCLALVVAPAVQSANPQAVVKTDLGTIVFELYQEKAPVSVANFINYAKSDFYNGTIFHRVIPGFMAQTGGLTFDFIKKETGDAIVNESGNGLKNTRGTIAMARLNHPNSATSQFFINLNDNTHLDATRKQPGYAVFGRVIEGMDVVDKIVDEPRGQYRQYRDAPNVPVRILSVTITAAE